MQVRELTLSGLKLIFPKVHKDSRGFFIETYQSKRYEEHGVYTHFVQDNHSCSKRGTLRGLHYQSHPGQAKLVRVGRGKIFDVVVDIRQNSPTFGKWEAVLLDDESHAQLFIPIGFAHGFCVLSEEADVIYKVDSNYDASTERSIRWDDPDIAIEWPLSSGKILVSERDRIAPYLSEAFRWQTLGDT